MDQNPSAYMRLVSFHIKKYRSIEDSGEIKINGNITTFVGINESGKTNILRALKKINHTSETDFDDLTEKPIWYPGKYDDKEIFITATFKLDEIEKEKIKNINNGRILDEIKFSKMKNMKIICHLESNQKPMPFDVFNKNYLQPILSILHNIDSSFVNGQHYKNNIISIFTQIEKNCKNTPNIRQNQFLNQIKKSIQTFEKTIPTIPKNYLDRLVIRSLLIKINSEIATDSTEKAKNYLIEKLPRFIYFDNIGIIDSRIHLPSFIEKLDSNNLDKDDRTAKTLLDLGGLDPHELLDLSKEDGDRNIVRRNKDRLSQITALASKKVSEEINKLWESNDHDIEFDVNGHDFRVWVVNKHDKTRLQLEERSRGYQWYFSFYTVFNVESEQQHKDAIILLDEPALFLHAKGQEDFLTKTLPILVKKNQIIYTTHSPSMIDLSQPDTIHTVTLKEKIINKSKQKVSHISNDVWDSDRDALFPLQSALHHTMAQSMFIGKKNLIVEGLSDFWILKSMSTLLESADKKHLKNDFVFVPVGGGMKSVFFATTYKSQDLDVAVLLDADGEGKKAYDSIVKNKILIEKKISLLNELCNKTNDMSIEDLFPQDYYLKFVKSSYQKELNEKKISEINLTSQNPMIIKQIDQFFIDNDLGKFNKTRPNKEIMIALGATKVEDLPPELVANFEIIFEGINKMLD